MGGEIEEFGWNGLNERGTEKNGKIIKISR